MKDLLNFSSQDIAESVHDRHQNTSEMKTYINEEINKSNTKTAR